MFARYRGERKAHLRWTLRRTVVVINTFLDTVVLGCNLDARWQLGRFESAVELSVQF